MACVAVLAFSLLAIPLVSMPVEAVTPTYMSKTREVCLQPYYSYYWGAFLSAGSNDKDWSVTFEIALKSGSPDSVQGAIWTGYVYDATSWAQVGRWAGTEFHDWMWQGYGVHSGTVAGHAANKAEIDFWVENWDTAYQCYELRVTAYYY